MFIGHGCGTKNPKTEFDIMFSVPNSFCEVRGLIPMQQTSSHYDEMCASVFATMVSENYIWNRYSGGLRTGDATSEHDFCCTSSHHISERLHDMVKKVSP